MVIDTSGLVAILQREPERRAFIEALEAADARLMSVATFVEISIVIEARHGAEGLRDLDHFIGREGVGLSIQVELGRDLVAAPEVWGGFIVAEKCRGFSR